MRILLATDAWAPQINGVVRTYENIRKQLEQWGNDVYVIHPDLFNTMPCPSYPEIRLAVLPKTLTAKLIGKYQPDAVHIATEGPVGSAARSYCMNNKIPFTTSFHTQFPEYIRKRVLVPLNLSYAYIRDFHRPACRTLVPTESQKQKLVERGFSKLVTWSRGVDTEIFNPAKKHRYESAGPIFLYMGRVAVEKGIDEFLDLDLPGSKVIVGDGPDLERLKKIYKDVIFTGFKTGHELAEYVAGADVFVFPSRTDTFGIVLIEAMACGLPVAAFPVTGPVDVVENGITGILDNDLQKAAIAALKLNSEKCISAASKFTWKASAQAFLSKLQPVLHNRMYVGKRLVPEYQDTF